MLIDLRSDPLVADDYAGAVVEFDAGYPEPVASVYGSYFDALAVFNAAADERRDAALAAFEL